MCLVNEFGKAVGRELVVQRERESGADWLKHGVIVSSRRRSTGTIAMACGLAFEKYGWSGEEENGKVDAVSGGCVTAYSWEDTEDHVKIRLPVDLAVIPTSLDWTVWSVRLAFSGNEGSIFEVKSLGARITSAEVTRSRRDGAPILVLVKETKVPWMHLIGSAAATGGQCGARNVREDSESGLSDSQLEEASGEEDFAGAGVDDNEEDEWENDAEFDSDEDDLQKIHESATQAIDPEVECDDIGDGAPIREAAYEQTTTAIHHLPDALTQHYPES